MLLHGATYFATAAIETRGYSMLLRTGDVRGVDVEQAFLAANSLVGAAGAGFFYLLPVSGVALGLGMLGSAQWSPWVGRLGVAIGGTVLALALVGVRLSFFSVKNGDFVALWYCVVGLFVVATNRASAAH